MAIKHSLQGSFLFFALYFEYLFSLDSSTQLLLLPLTASEPVILYSSYGVFRQSGHTTQWVISYFSHCQPFEYALHEDRYISLLDTPNTFFLGKNIYWGCLSRRSEDVRETEKIIGGSRKVFNEEIYDMYSSPNTCYYSGDHIKADEMNKICSTHGN